MLNEDEKYRTLRDSLKALPKIRAKSDFESRLFQRIKNAEKTPVHNTVINVTKKEPLLKGWLANLFRPAFAPALGLTAVLLITIVVYFAFFNKMNDGGISENNQTVNPTNNGELIIYVKKDTGSYSSNYPKEYSAINPEDTRSETDAAPMETPTDFFSRPETPAPIDGLIKPDRVSEEQKIEMQKTGDMEKGVDVKGERKSDDGIMKKESKNEGKIRSEESPYNIRDEKKNENNNEVKQEEFEDKAVPKSGVDTKRSSKKDSINLGKTVEDSVKSHDRKTDVDDQTQTDEKEENKSDPAIEQKIEQK